MPVQLSEVEARILGSLVEKSLTTPDLYPLTLNSLTNACNQKSSREPIMNVDDATVARSLASLQEKGLAGRRSEPGSRVTKFMHHVENLLNGGNAKEVGAICVLLLRGPQTAGEIKGRTDRLCEYTGTAEVEATLHDLAARSDGPYVERMPRQPGQKEARWRHLFGGPPSTPEVPTVPAFVPASGLSGAAPGGDGASAVPPGGSSDRVTVLERRVEKLEASLRALQDKLKGLAG